MDDPARLDDFLDDHDITVAMIRAARCEHPKVGSKGRVLVSLGLLGAGTIATSSAAAASTGGVGMASAGSAGGATAGSAAGVTGAVGTVAGTAVATAGSMSVTTLIASAGAVSVAKWAGVGVVAGALALGSSAGVRMVSGRRENAIQEGRSYAADRVDSSSQRQGRASNDPQVASTGVAIVPAVTRPTAAPGASPEAQLGGNRAGQRGERSESWRSMGSRADAKTGNASETTQLSGEIAVLDAARRALALGEPQMATDVLSRYRASYPDGRMHLEADVLQVQAWLLLGDRASARRLAATIESEHPNTPYANRISSLFEASESTRDRDAPSRPLDR